MGKWSKFKDTLDRMIGSAPAEGEGQGNSWNDRVEALKAEFAAMTDEAGVPLTKEALAGHYSELRDEKDELERQAKAVGERVEALTRLLVGRIEGDGATGLALAGGEKLNLDDKPHSTVEDKQRFLAWVREQRLESMLNLPWQTMNAIVGERLEAGLEPPPGVKVHLRTGIRRIKGKEGKPKAGGVVANPEDDAFLPEFLNGGDE